MCLSSLTNLALFITCSGFFLILPLAELLKQLPRHYPRDFNFLGNECLVHRNQRFLPSFSISLTNEVSSISLINFKMNNYIYIYIPFSNLNWSNFIFETFTDKSKFLNNFKAEKQFPQLFFTNAFCRIE